MASDNPESLEVLTALFKECRASRKAENDRLDLQLSSLNKSQATTMKAINELRVDIARLQVRTTILASFMGILGGFGAVLISFIIRGHV